MTWTKITDGCCLNYCTCPDKPDINPGNSRFKLVYTVSTNQTILTGLERVDLVQTVKIESESTVRCGLVTQFNLVWNQSLHIRIIAQVVGSL
jgi:hypothetical protein